MFLAWSGPEVTPTPKHDFPTRPKPGGNRLRCIFFVMLNTEMRLPLLPVQ